MSYVITPADRALFKRCRRAWDFGARARLNYVPIDSPPTIDIDRALHEALAVYYYPGMWDWDRAIVLPLARQAFRRSMDAQWAHLPPERRTEWERHVEQGERLLDAYFCWAPSVDDFAPIQVETDVDVYLPDPSRPGEALVDPQAGPVQYQCRVELLAIDADDAYWVIDHRIGDGDWVELDHLVLDEQALSWCWAWREFYQGMRVTGTIYNELHLNAPLPQSPAPRQARTQPSPVTQHRRTYKPPPSEPSDSVDRIRVEHESAFRRTRIWRSDAELENVEARVAEEARDMLDPELRLYPNPSVDNCAVCDYRRPCKALNDGADVHAVLAEGYQKRPPPPIREGRIGVSSWGVGRAAAPPNFGRR